MENFELSKIDVTQLTNEDLKNYDGGIIWIIMGAAGLAIAGGQLMYNIGKDLGEMWAEAEE